MALGFAKDPFIEISNRVHGLTDAMEERRKLFVSSLAHAEIGPGERNATIDRHDRYALMIHAAMFYALTGYRISSSMAPDILESSRGVKEFADFILSRRVLDVGDPRRESDGL